MFILLKNDTSEIVASFVSKERADDFINALSRPLDYRLFSTVQETKPNYAEVNRIQITDELRFIAESKKISAIKLYRAIYNASLSEAKTVIENKYA